MIYYTVAVLATLLILSLMSIRRPGIACGLMWSVFALEQMVQSHIAWFGTYATALNLMLALVVLVALLFGEHRPYPKIELRGVSLMVIAYIAYMVLAAFWAPDLKFSIKWIKRFMPYTVGIGILAPLCVRRQIDLRDLLVTTSLFGGVVCLGLSASNYDRGRLMLMNIDGVGNLAKGNYLQTGSYAAMVSICGLGLATSEMKPKWRNIYIATAIAAGLALFRSSARGATLGLIVAMGILGWMTIRPANRSRQAVYLARLARNVAVFTVVVGCTAAVFAPFFAETADVWTARFEHNSSAVTTRFGYAEKLVEIYLSTPKAWVTGLGTGASTPLIGGYCHVVPVEVLVEHGLVGAFLYLGIIFGTIRTLFVLLRRFSGTTQSRYLTILLSLFVHLCLLQLKEGATVSIWNLANLAIIVGFVERHYKENLSRSDGKKMRVSAARQSQMRNLASRGLK